MAKINELIAQIKGARLARDVRDSIADSIEALAYKKNSKTITLDDAADSILLTDLLCEDMDEVDIYISGGASSTTGAILIQLNQNEGPYQILKPAMSMRSHIHVKRLGLCFAVESNDFSHVVDTSAVTRINLIASGIKFNKGTVVRMFTA